MNKNIIEFSYEDEMKESFRDYAVSVIVGRALPDVRDGFKPVHRRILYAMKNLGILPNSSYKKSARITGEIIGKYHPHGDQAVYEAMVGMSQDFKQNLPLIDGHGNFGSIDGDSAAAMRYTEARLSPESLYILQDLDKNVVDFRDNYDGEEREPTVLPAKFPNLLVNGTFGIAVGMQSRIPPHNVGEVIDAFLHYMKNPNVSIDELIDIVSGPDYPTGGIIINKDEFQKFYRTGEGKAIIRSKIEIEPAPYGKTNLIITEIPFSLSGSKGRFINDLMEKVIDKKLNEVTDIRDESSKDGVRIILELKKGTDIDKFLTKLYVRTKVQDNESYQFIALVDGKPTKLSLKDYFHHYLEFQKEITRRKYEYLHEKGLRRKEILDGLIEAIDKIDAIIETIRGSKNTTQMMNCLMKGQTEGIAFRLKKNEKIAQKFSFTERQAKAILEMRLQRLGALEVKDLEKEHKNLLNELKRYRKILDKPKEMMKVIKKEHENFKKTFNAPRKTQLENIKQKKYVEEKKIEDVLVLVDRFGYAKTLDSGNYNVQELEKDYKYVLPTTSDDKLVVFTNEGFIYQIKLDDVPKGKLKDKGLTVQSLANLNRREYPIYVTTFKLLEKGTYLFVTKLGLTKQTKGINLVSNRSRVIGTKLNKDDGLIFVEEITPNSDQVVFQTKRGYVARMKLDEFSIMGKTAKGVMSINLKEDDELEHIHLLKEGGIKDLSIHGKTVKTSEIPPTKRGSSGKQIK